MRLNNLVVDSCNGKTAVLFEVDGDFTSEQLLALLTGGSPTLATKPVTTVTPKKRGRPRKSEAPAPQASTPPQTTQPQGKRKYFRRAGAIELPLNECIGHAFYPTKKGNTLVAIHKEGEKNGKKWMRVLWVNEETQTAFHPQGGFFASLDKITGIVRY